MKLKANFVLRKVTDMWVVLPLAEQTLNFNGMLTLNDSGVLLWKHLEQGCDRHALAVVLTETYDVTIQQALADVDEFIQKLLQAGCMEE